jgi:hypothetical protein
VCCKRLCSGVFAIAAGAHVQASDSTSWWDCHKCGFSFIARFQPDIKTKCQALRLSGPPEFRNCALPHYRFIDHGLYAAQLAWWLSFFPPERFLIISAWQLHDLDEAVRVCCCCLLLRCACWAVHCIPHTQVVCSWLIEVCGMPRGPALRACLS